jgi:hypothetical protein
MSDASKPIVISTHAALRMRQRGATEAEVESVIRSEVWHPAQRGKWRAKQRFALSGTSPESQKRYQFKAVEVVFAERDASIVVVTVKVFYYN